MDGQKLTQDHLSENGITFTGDENANWKSTPHVAALKNGLLKFDNIVTTTTEREASSYQVRRNPKPMKPRFNNVIVDRTAEWFFTTYRPWVSACLDQWKAEELRQKLRKNLHVNSDDSEAAILDDDSDSESVQSDVQSSSDPESDVTGSENEDNADSTQNTSLSSDSSTDSDSNSGTSVGKRLKPRKKSSAKPGCVSRVCSKGTI
ncbi:MAG: hypothetical protein Q9164_005964, partial [Protoblastenia rupestris]